MGHSVHELTHYLLKVAVLCDHLFVEFLSRLTVITSTYMYAIKLVDETLPLFALWQCQFQVG